MEKREKDQPTIAQQPMLEELAWASRCLSILAAATLGILLYLLRPVLVPFVIAIFLTVGLKPILDFLQNRLRANRIVAVVMAFFMGVALLMLLSLAVVYSIDQLANDDAYQRRAAEVTEQLASIAEYLGALPVPEEGDAQTSAVMRFRSLVGQGVTSAQQWLLGGMISMSGTLGVVLIYMFFLLLGASSQANLGGDVSVMVLEKLRVYLVLKTLISLVTGIAVWGTMAIFGIPLAVLMGLLTFLLNYIPNFGPLVTCVLPLPLIWLSPELSLVSMTIATILVIGIQLVSGNVVEPRMMGSSFDLHPIVVMLALMLWFSSWGFVGMLLAVPITASIKVVLQRIRRTEPIALLMAGDLSVLQLGPEKESGEPG